MKKFLIEVSANFAARKGKRKNEDFKKLNFLFPRVKNYESKQKIPTDCSCENKYTQNEMVSFSEQMVFEENIFTYMK